MNRLQTKMQPGEGWLSADAARLAYDLTERELVELTANLKRSGACCPRKGLAIAALDRAVAQLREEG
jgi:hypothetical protein